MTHEVGRWQAEPFSGGLKLLLESSEYKSTVENKQEHSSCLTDSYHLRHWLEYMNRSLLSLQNISTFTIIRTEVLDKKNSTAVFHSVKTIKHYLSISVQQALHCRAKQVDILFQLLCTFLETENSSASGKQQIHLKLAENTPFRILLPSWDAPPHLFPLGRGPLNHRVSSLVSCQPCQEPDRYFLSSSPCRQSKGKTERLKTLLEVQWIGRPCDGILGRIIFIRDARY